MDALQLVNIAAVVIAVDAVNEDTVPGAREQMNSGMLETASLAAELKLFT